MQTRAYLQGHCKELHDECEKVLKMVQAEFWAAFKPVRTCSICVVIFFAIAFLIGPKSLYFVGDELNFTLHCVLVWSVGSLMSAFLWRVRAIIVENMEVSDQLYASLSDLRRRYEDLDGLREKQPILNLGTLRLHMGRLMEALKSDMAHPHRKSYRYDEGEKIEFFEFYNYQKEQR